MQTLAPRGLNFLMRRMFFKINSTRFFLLALTSSLCIVASLYFPALLSRRQPSSHPAAATTQPTSSDLPGERSVASHLSQSGDVKAAIGGIAETRVKESYGRLPVAFEENTGRHDGKVKYSARGSGFQLFLTSDEAVLSLSKPSTEDSREHHPQGVPAAAESTRATESSAVLRMKLIGANRRARVKGEDRLATQSNYFVGAKREDWHTGVAMFEKVRYAEVYPGVDVVYYGNQRQLEYDFVVAPHADPARIKFKFGGAQHLHLDAEGHLLLQTQGGSVRQEKPFVYQLVEGRRQEVAGRYALKESGEIGFTVGQYDHSQPLVIDPILNYSTYLGGIRNDEALGIALDGQGNAYLTGYTASSNFPTATPFQAAKSTDTDAFVLKLNPAGTTLVYATYLGGNDSDRGHAIAVDSAGNAYITGETYSNNFPRTSGTLQGSNAGDSDGFITKLNAAGSALIYSSYLGGENYDGGYGVATDATGNAYVTGETESSTFSGVVTPKQGHSVYKSGDAGVTWNASSSGLPVPQIVELTVDPTDSSILYAVRYSGIFKSYDRGASWSRTGQGDPSVLPFFPRSVAVDPSTPTTLYAATYSGIYKSIDGGAVWKYSSDDFSESSAYLVSCIAIDPNSPSTVYAGTADGVYKSVNGGASWQRAYNVYRQFPHRVNKIIFDPTDSKILYAATTAGVYKSLDGAASWMPSGNGLNGTNTITSLAISPASPATVYAGTANGIFKSTNGGLNWVAINNGLPVRIPNSPTITTWITSVVVSPATATTLYAGSLLNGVFKSTDGGANWTASNNGLANSTVTSLAIDHSAAENLYASTDSGSDGFVVKINAGGNFIDYIRYLGGDEHELGRGIATDPDGNAYITGETRSINFPTLNPAQANGGGILFDAFVTKLASNGSPVYSTYLGGSNGEQGFGIAVSAAGNAHITGNTWSNDFPTAGARRTTSHPSGVDAFVTKLSVSGSTLDYSVYVGGSATDQASAIALDGSGHAYVTGATTSSDFPAMNSAQAVYGEGRDAFALKLNPLGDILYSTYVGGSFNDQGFGIAVDGNGAAYIAGTTNSFNFPTSSPLQAFQSGGSDAFITRIAPSVDLSVTISDAPDPVALGGDLTYTIKVTNVGELTATGVRLNDTLPAGSVLVSAATSVGACSGDTSVNCVLGAFAAGESATVTVVIKPPAVRTITSAVSVTANEQEVITANNTATQQTLVDFAELSLTAGALQGLVTAGGRVMYVLAVSNNGVTTAGNVNVSVDLPAGLANVSCVVPGGACGGTGNSRTVTIQTLAANESRTIRIDATVESHVANDTELSVTGKTSSLLPDQDLSNNSAKATAIVASTIVPPKSNGKIAFTLDGVYVMNDDGTNIKKIYSEAGGTFSLATWSPDGTKIAFMNEVDYSPIDQVRVVNADGSEPRVLSNNGNIDSRPTWSPSGAFVAFKARDGKSIQIVNATGKPVETSLFTTSFLTPTSSFSNVSWSPDGTKLLCEVNYREFWTVDVDGSNPKLLDTDPNTSDSMPAWSPDGTKIVFLRQFNNPHSDSTSIYTMNADGTNAQPLPNPVAGRPSSLKRPVFSPDGTMIAFEHQVKINGSAYLAPGILKVNVDGTNITRIPADGQGGSAPSWQGLPASGPPPTPVPTFKISGHVAPPGGTSIFQPAYVRLDLTGSRTASAYPDDNGNYSFTLPAGGNYTVTPAVNPYYNFNPGSYTFDNLSADQSNANFTTTLVNYSISGRVTDTNGAPLDNVEITLLRQGVLQSTRRTGRDGTYAFNDLLYRQTYTVRISRANYDFAPDLETFILTQSEVVNSVGTPKNSFQFTTDPFLVNEGDGRVTVSITRAGLPSTLAAPASVTVQTFDNPAAVPCDPTVKRPDGTAYPQGAAYARCDYATTVEIVQFAPGETQKTVSIPIIDDAHVEVAETVSVYLSNALGATLGRMNSINVVIHDNDTAAAENPTRTTSFFVRQHYLDFLSREPEAGEPWSSVLDRCPNAFNLDAQNVSASCDRLIVSQSFFGSPEFRLKGFYVFNFYRVAFNRRPNYEEIIPDMRRVSGATTDEVYGKRAAFPTNFTNREEFKTIYDGLGNAAFIDTLMGRYGLQQVTTPDPANPEAGTKVVLTREELLIRMNSTNSQMMTRAQVLRAIVESDEVGAAEYNRAFVAMQYYGYLRRTPEEDGYQAWLKVINEDPNNIRIMVNGFMNSTEYRSRFGQP